MYECITCDLIQGSTNQNLLVTRTGPNQGQEILRKSGPTRTGTRKNENLGLVRTRTNNVGSTYFKVFGATRTSRKVSGIFGPDGQALTGREPKKITHKNVGPDQNQQKIQPRAEKIDL